jgi:MSHA biogenesis protein MshI
MPMNMKFRPIDWFKQKNSNTWTAIRCSDQYTSLATVTMRKNAKPLVTMAELAFGHTQDLASFKALSQQYQLKNTPCSFVLDFNDYQLQQIEKPNVPINELKQAASWKVKELIDYPVEQATFNLVDIPTDPANNKRQQYMFSVSAKNQFIGELSNQLIDAGINLKAIDARVMAQRNLAQLLEEPNRGIAMLSFNHCGGLLTFTSGGELFHTRLLETVGERNKNTFDSISLELQRSLDHFDSQFPYVTINKIMIAPFESRDAFCAHLRNYINIAVVSFELTDIFDFDGSIDLKDLKHQSSLLAVLGAAMREGATA